MTETARIKQLFEDLFDGKPWLDVTIMGTLKELDYSEAYRRRVPGRNTIWEIVNHMIAWRIAVLKRVNGAMITAPDHNYFEPVTNPSAQAWNDAINQLKQTQTDWINFLDQLTEEYFSTVYPNNNMTYFQHIQGILQHDAYHIGQIVLLARIG